MRGKSSDFLKNHEKKALQFFDVRGKMTYIRKFEYKRKVKVIVWLRKKS